MKREGQAPRMEKTGNTVGLLDPSAASGAQVKKGRPVIFPHCRTVFSLVIFFCTVISMLFGYDTFSSAAHTATHRELQSDPFQGYNCTGERMNHNQKLYTNTFLCSSSNAYIFGMNDRGDLIWKDLSTGEKKVYFKNKNLVIPNYFMLTVRGKFRVYSDNGVMLWGKKSKYDNIGYHECLAEFPCPYLHLHGKRGVCVLNWIDPTTGQWVANNINHAFNFGD